MAAAEERYKRLEWGWYIGTNVGRFNKMWAKTDYENRRDEQHITFSKEVNEKLDKMFASKTKQPRFFPDDPYEKYNRKVNFWKYNWGLQKNRELIRKYGNPVYKFDRYKAHMFVQSDENEHSHLYYAPPGYLENIGGNNGVYRPDPALEPPAIETAPHFQRKRIEWKGKRPYGKKGRPMDNRIWEMRDRELYLNKPLPLWSQINFPTIHPN